MKEVRIIAIGDNVADMYLSRGVMYPGGQCINTCVYAGMNGAKTAYLGKFGNDRVATYNQKILSELGIDFSHSRFFQGENGYAKVTLKDNDRVFLGSNNGGVAKEHSYRFREEDFSYIKSFHIIYTNLNSYIEKDLPALKQTGVPVVYDFSNRWTDLYLETVCPHVKIATLSCAHLTEEQRIREMKKVQWLGVKLVLGTVGEEGSYLLYKNRFLYMPTVPTTKLRDTMGAGDSYLAAFLVSLLKHSEQGDLFCEDEDEMFEIFVESMNNGAQFASNICSMEGAFGYGIPITGEGSIV